MKTPQAPDPMATAQAQSGLNTDTALTQQLVNFTNQEGPWGSTTYNPTGTQSFVNSQGQTIEIPQYTQTTQYSPEQQAIFDKTTAAQTNIADIASQQSNSLKDYLNTGFDFGTEGQPQQTVTGAGQFGYSSQAPGQTVTGVDPFSFDNQDAADWSFDLASQRILPEQQRQQAALETQLVNKGIRPGTAAWNSEMERLGRTNSDQMNQLALTGRQQAFGEALGAYQQNDATSFARQNAAYQQQLASQQQNAGQEISAFQANDSSKLAREQAMFQQQIAARQQAFQEAVTGRNQPINEITALLSGSQIANPNTGFSATPQASVGGVDYTGLVNNQFQTQAANAGGMMGGLFGLAGTGLNVAQKAGAFSDRRLKKNIRRVGTLDNGLPVYSFDYLWGGPTQIGLMSDDVRKADPGAVAVHSSGFDMVDYERAAA